MTEETTTEATVESIRTFAQLKALVEVEFPDTDNPNATVCDEEMAAVLDYLWEHKENYPTTRAKKGTSQVFIAAVGQPEYREQLLADITIGLDKHEAAMKAQPAPEPASDEEPIPEPVKLESNEDPIYDIFGQKFTNAKAYRARVRTWCRAKANQYTWETQNKVYIIDRSSQNLPTAYVWFDQDSMTLEYSLDPADTPAPVTTTEKAVEETHNAIDNLLSE